MILILMGVSGCGKTTVGELLAKNLGWPFYDGDDYHPAANVEKMRAGIPLTDEDREAWIAALRRLIGELGRDAVIACSALKQKYRDRLQSARAPEVRLVYLKGSFELIQQRISKRRHRYMNPALLSSQFEALEEPAGALTLDIALPPAAIVAQICAHFKLQPKPQPAADQSAIPSLNRFQQ